MSGWERGFGRNLYIAGNCLPRPSEGTRDHHVDPLDLVSWTCRWGHLEG